MMQLWIVAALIVPACRDRVKAEHAKKEETSLEIFVDNNPHASITFSSNTTQVPFNMGYNSDGAVMGVFAYGRPDFEMSGDTACYTVHLGHARFDEAE